jgi:hypothetical protein
MVKNRDHNMPPDLAMQQKRYGVGSPNIVSPNVILPNVVLPNDVLG